MAKLVSQLKLNSDNRSVLLASDSATGAARWTMALTKLVAVRPENRVRDRDDWARARVLFAEELDTRCGHTERPVSWLPDWAPWRRCNLAAPVERTVDLFDAQSEVPQDSPRQKVLR